MGSKGELSDYHTHKDGSKGWDINIKSHDGHGNTEHKAHVVDYSGVGEKAADVLTGAAEIIGGVFDAIFGRK